MIAPTFSRPDRPDVRPIELLHRGADHYIPFYRLDEGGEMRELDSLPAHHLGGLFPELAPVLEADSFYAINGFWQPSTKRMTRKKQYLQNINAVHVDIDCYSREITVGQAVGAMIDLQDAGHLPSISMILLSGRGVWGFWFLRDRLEGRFGQRATSYAKLQADLVNRELCRRLQEIGADTQSRDLCRITRVPGSVNGKVCKRVEYWIRTDEAGHVATYLLDDIAGLVGVTLPTFRPTTTEKSVDRQRAGMAGYKVRWLRELERFQYLMEARKCFVEGTRGASVWVYLTILRRVQVVLKNSDEAVAARMEILWSKLDQPQIGKAKREYTRRQFDQAMVRPNTAAHPSHRAIADGLRINRHEAEVTGWPEWDVPAEQPMTDTEKRDERHRLLRMLLFATDGKQRPVPSLRDLQEWIEFTDDRLSCSFRTIQTDLERLGIRNPRRLTKPKSTGLFAESDTD